MRFGSIRVRLTAWYLAMLALGLAVFGVGSWYRDARQRVPYDR